MCLVLRRRTSFFLGARKRQAIPTLGQSDASFANAGSQNTNSGKRGKLMKILYLISETNISGSILSFLTLVDFVKQKGDTPFVIIPNNNINFVNFLKSQNIPFFTIPLIFHCYPSKKCGHWAKRFLLTCFMLFREFQNIRRLNKVIKDIKPDIIHTNVGPLTTGHYAAKKNGIPHIWHIREYGDLDFDLKIFPSKQYFHKLLNQDFVISITKKLFEYNKLKTNSNAFVIYNGVRGKDDIHYVFPKAKYFLCASRISPEKGHPDIIIAFSKFHKNHPEYKLVILGDGNHNYIETLKRLANEHNCSDAIIFKGFVSNVSDYMQKATALLVGSHFEGFGRMTAEACFDGCIVIGKNSGGTQEILSQTGGFLYNTPNELLHFMEKTATFSAETYHSIAKKAQETAQEIFSVEGYTQKIYSIYTRVLKT